MGGDFTPQPSYKPLKILKQPNDVSVQGVSYIQIPIVYSNATQNCGSDPNMAQIYSHESGCSTSSINSSSGACGLGQAYPCSKMPCSLSDWACQNLFFTQYAIARYGSTAAAWAYWQANSVW